MRTTIEMKPEHRIRILALAANRGEKGFSGVIAEALEFYLHAQNSRAKAIQNALAAKGSISQKEAADAVEQLIRRGALVTKPWTDPAIRSAWPRV